MSNLFTDLQKVKAEQEQVLTSSVAAPIPKPEEKKEQVAQKTAQPSEQVSKRMSKSLSKSITQDAVEELAFSLRKTPQSKLNANVPIAWKDKLDDLAFRLKVGKYELVTYLVGVCIGEVDPPKE